MPNIPAPDPFDPRPPDVAAGTDGHLTPVTTEPPPHAQSPVLTCGPFSGIVHKAGLQRGNHRMTVERPGEPMDHCSGPTTAELKEPG